MQPHIIKKLQNLLDEACENSSECGLQLAIFVNGKPFADLTAGYADAEKKRPVQNNTLFPVFSVGKGILSTVAHRLVRRGTLSYATRIADVWPEYAQNGKQDTLFWHALSHRAGNQNTPWPETLEQLADWDFMCNACANATPAWKPGTKHAYHGITFAWLVGNTLQQADGRPIKQLIQDEVINPLGLQNEMFFGTTDKADENLAEIVLGDAPYSDLHKKTQTDIIRHACIPSFTGYMSARAIAKHYAALLDATTLDHPLLDDDTLQNAAIVRRLPGDEPAPNAWSKHGLGYVCSGFPEEIGRILGHGGALGAEGFIDRKSHIAFGFTRNQTDSKIPNLPLRDAISDVLGLPHRHW